MKPFNIELAKAGHPVYTRDGRSARIICFDAKNEYPIVVLVEKDGIESVARYTTEGFYFSSDRGYYLDLMMKSTKKEGWINIYKNGRTSFIYETKEDAFINHLDTNYLDTVKIEWEE